MLEGAKFGWLYGDFNWFCVQHLEPTLCGLYLVSLLFERLNTSSVLKMHNVFVAWNLNFFFVEESMVG
jgi:hypothetical protein